MSRFFQLSLIVLCMSFALLAGCASSRTTSMNATPVIVTTVPAPKEVVVVPRGYMACTITPAGYYNNMWIPAHRVCRYNKPGKVAWVEGYWACTQYDTMGRCSYWKWNRAHWVKVYTVY